MRENERKRKRYTPTSRDAHVDEILLSFIFALSMSYLASSPGHTQLFQCCMFQWDEASPINEFYSMHCNTNVAHFLFSCIKK